MTLRRLWTVATIAGTVFGFWRALDVAPASVPFGVVVAIANLILQGRLAQAVESSIRARGIGRSATGALAVGCLVVAVLLAFACGVGAFLLGYALGAAAWR
jgi:hypothetical protein